MNKIELSENDGYLYDDGNPKTFIFRVNGRMFPVDEKVTIGEFYRRVSSLNLSPGPSMVSEDLQPEHKKPSLVQVPPSNLKGISSGDIIRCINVPEDTIGGGELGKDNEKAVAGKEYLVQKVIMKNSIVQGYEAVPVNSDWPQQIFLRAKDVEFVRKGLPKEEPVNGISAIIKCIDCEKDMSVSLDDTESNYKGTCEYCNTHQIYPRQEFTCKCGQKNMLMVIEGVIANGRCQKCGAEQHVPLHTAI